jgi:hypothetical protein
VDQYKVWAIYAYDTNKVRGSVVVKCETSKDWNLELLVSTTGFIAGNCMFYYFLTVNSQTKPTKWQKYCIYIDNVCEFTVKIIEHTVASYITSDTHKNF